MGFPYVDAHGTLRERIVRVELGDLILFPTTVFHFGCSHADFCGHKISRWRRRVFWYLDAVDSASDEYGSVLGPKELRGIPRDYSVDFIEGLPSLYAAHLIMSSERLWLERPFLTDNLGATTVLARHFADRERAVRRHDDPENKVEGVMTKEDYQAKMIPFPEWSIPNDMYQ